MTRRFGSTGAAAALTAAAVLLPCAAWWWYGSRAVDQQAARLVAAPKQQARLEAQRLALQISRRLEALRLSESRRPFTDYAADPSAFGPDCSYGNKLGSPLANGPGDPLIWTHFQIDDVGELSLPTLVVRTTPPLAPSAAEAGQLEILEELECSGSQQLAQLRRRSADGSAAIHSNGGVVAVAPFVWNTLELKSGRALVALREVTTPTVVLTQGFIVQHAALNGLLSSSLHPATTRSGAPISPAEAPIGVDGLEWTVAVDATQAIAAAAAEAGRVRNRFRTSFFVGACGALLAAAAVVMLVYRSEQLALQRAQFAASAAHELRTPLAGLRLYGEMLAEGSGSAERSTAYARRMAGEAERLGRVVSNVLGISRLERGGLRLEPAPGNLGSAVRASLERLRPALEANGARIELSIAEDLPATIFDPDAVHQILQNLLDNAEKYTRSSPSRTIEVRLRRGARGPLLSVSDRGQGVAHAVRRKLFRPFSGNPDRDAPEGLGIGLALVRALAEAQQAKVFHTDVAQGGAEFSVQFRTAA